MSKSLGNVIAPRRPGRRLRARPGALFPAARGAVRQRRRFQPPRAGRQRHERRAGQRSRQPGAALAEPDRAQLRRPAAGARRAHRGRRRHAGRRRGAARRCCAAASTARPSTRRWRRCGRWCAPPTAISTARRPGRCARPTRRGWRRCCGCWPTCCASSPPCCSRSCRAAWRKMLDQLGVPAEARDLAALAAPLPDGTAAAAAAGGVSALCR